MITDGYTIHGKIGPHPFSYRPALREERREVLEVLRNTGSREFLEEFLRRHVVAGNMGCPQEIREALFLVCLGLLPLESGESWSRRGEKDEADNLRRGVILTLNHPQFSRRDCEMCRKWWYDDDTGEIVKRGGKELLRPSDTVLLCETNEGCPNGTPKDPHRLTPRNQRAWMHYKHCQAAGSFPDDPIVKRNAWIIQQAEKKAKSGRK